MRQLKFRVWNQYTNSWYKNSMDYLKFWLGADYPPTINVDKMGLGVVPNKYIQQYTGLKDRHSVEIYEGDIVRTFSDEFINGNVTGYILFDDGCFLIKVSNTDIRCVFDGEDIEVIGNMFESPELIKTRISSHHGTHTDN